MKKLLKTASCLILFLVSVSALAANPTKVTFDPNNGFGHTIFEYTKSVKFYVSNHPNVNYQITPNKLVFNLNLENHATINLTALTNESWLPPKLTAQCPTANAGDQPTYQIEIENNVNAGQVQLVCSRIGN